MKAKVRIKKAENGNLYVVKTCRFISSDDVDDLKKKQRKIRKREKNDPFD
jgi:hypothetical protein